MFKRDVAAGAGPASRRSTTLPGMRNLKYRRATSRSRQKYSVEAPSDIARHDMLPYLSTLPESPSSRRCVFPDLVIEYAYKGASTAPSSTALGEYSPPITRPPVGPLRHHRAVSFVLFLSKASSSPGPDIRRPTAIAIFGADIT